MKAKLIDIGNSKGVRLPKSIIEQCELENQLNIEVINKKIIISKSNNPRDGWNEKFKDLGKESLENNDFIQNKFDEEEWEW
ncbi:MAG: AbrB/MazE/SpoVT family DNA-binding domain-containing protein [Thermodesulfobacteriota bacterium]